ncbi:hypothetical protein EJ05DRAFT_498262 [Pseudovirgaria hyperparasitica]|uniref:Uncharacterized protein n=1 Tax=Pseudovirgaria hyperparasitica TaxID=470096 RepID=A0A6A6WBS1_9PEZI|nr:uncharacterized protein EJ05DRAFT_498262 [Pseudovirgaria hyperparasitica]KAF2760298.1 hypothetical protein EJ05DRAFT_498262 [Pseudovirgaria hyperparasitica]
MSSSLTATRPPLVVFITLTTLTAITSSYSMIAQQSGHSRRHSKKLGSRYHPGCNIDLILQSEAALSKTQKTPTPSLRPFPSFLDQDVPKLSLDTNPHNSHGGK